MNIIIEWQIFDALFDIKSDENKTNAKIYPLFHVTYLIRIMYNKLNVFFRKSVLADVKGLLQSITLT